MFTVFGFALTLSEISLILGVLSGVFAVYYKQTNTNREVKGQNSEIIKKVDLIIQRNSEADLEHKILSDKVNKMEVAHNNTVAVVNAQGARQRSLEERQRNVDVFNGRMEERLISLHDSMDEIKDILKGKR